jgi:hypothetical protein
LFDINHPDYSLLQFAHEFKKFPQTIGKIPHELVDYFG